MASASSPEKRSTALRRSTIQTTGDALMPLSRPVHRLSIPELHLPEITDEADQDSPQQQKDVTAAPHPHLLFVPDSPGKLNRSQSWGTNIGDEDEAEAVAMRTRGRSHSLPPSILRKQVAHLSIRCAVADDDPGASRLHKPTSTARRVSFSLPSGSGIEGEGSREREPVRPWTPRADDLPNGKSSTMVDSKLPLVDVEIPREPLPTGSTVFQQVMADIAPPRLRSPPPPPSTSPPIDSSPSPPPSPPPLRHSPLKDVVKPKVNRQVKIAGHTGNDTPRNNSRSPKR